MRLSRCFAAAAALALAASPTLAKAQNWVVTWAAGEGCLPGSTQANIPPAGITYRNIVHVSLGGNQVKVRFSNRFGTQPLVIDAASVAKSGVQHNIVGGAVPLTFVGGFPVTIPAGQDVYSKPATINVSAQDNLSISFHIPQPANPIQRYTSHYKANQISWYSPGASQVNNASLNNAQGYRNWHFATAVDVAAVAGASAIVAIGDSITDGGDIVLNANHRWPDHLFQQLQAGVGTKKLAVANTGIGSTRILSAGADPNCTATDGYQPSIRSRWDNDALDLHGVKTIILLGGINDIAHTQDPDLVNKLKTAVTNMVAKATAAGIDVIGGVLTPTGDSNYGDPIELTRRDEYNTWIKSAASPFSKRINFETCVKDPGSNPVRWHYNPRWSSDNIHGNDLGTEQMGICAANAF